jgi:hypothetical protein
MACHVFRYERLPTARFEGDVKAFGFDDKMPVTRCLPAWTQKPKINPPNWLLGLSVIIKDRHFPVHDHSGSSERLVTADKHSEPIADSVFSFPLMILPQAATASEDHRQDERNVVLRKQGYPSRGVQAHWALACRRASAM